jgi:hypothetical protein
LRICLYIEPARNRLPSFRNADSFARHEQERVLGQEETTPEIPAADKASSDTGRPG